jgi:hypothetical protein
MKFNRNPVCLYRNDIKRIGRNYEKSIKQYDKVQRCCVTKTADATEEDARNAMISFQKMKEHSYDCIYFEKYKCSYCHQYHVGRGIWKKL